MGRLCAHILQIKQNALFPLSVMGMFGMPLEDFTKNNCIYVQMIFRGMFIL